MKKLLIVVDMQNDFIDGALGTPEAVAIVPNVVKKIAEWDGDIVCTADTHFDNYLQTNEGKHLPIPHCIDGSNGWKINEEVFNLLVDENIEHWFITKNTFGSTALIDDILKMKYDYVELVGLCTDICVISNALLIKTNCPEIDIAVDASCCAGVTPESHKAALTTMKMCQIDIIGE
ncbi:MAG: cysteine hydrolase [Eubacterium sp.]|nr:cysteine hydrolase [Eubacterium sp.]